MIDATVFLPGYCCSHLYFILFFFGCIVLEHRVFMELAFTFLDKYVFAMTTYESAVQDLRYILKI